VLTAAALLGVAMLIQSGAPAPTAESDVIARAMADAVRERFGAAADVEVTEVITAVTVPVGHLDAVPDSGGRVGGQLGFSLLVTRFSGGRVQAVRIGRASATVHVRADQVRMRRFVARGVELSANDADVERLEVGGVLLRRLPTLAEVLGGRALRDLPAGACVVAGAVVLQPVVRAGDDVMLTASGPDFQVSAAMKAVESGGVGAIIHVVNRDSRHAVRARIVSKGVVHILHD
jgi:flagella basal body P-ring formation protein FlgA